jgi:spore cortex formation protein SpoVR/YcgB (stage V sporulation)
MRELVIAFLLGALVAAGGAFWYEDRQTQDFAQALKLLKSGEYATAYTRAMAAYRQEEPSIAIWELNHLVALEQEDLKLGLETNGAMAGLMLTHARLAKLYRQEGREAEARTNASEAITMMRGLPRPDTSVSNLTTLLVRLEEFDAREKQKRSHE